MIVAAATSLEIPLASLIKPTHSSGTLRRSTANLPCSIAYTLNTDRENFLRPKRFDELTVHPYLARQFLRMVQHNEIKLAHFFFRAFIPSQYSNLGYFPFEQVLDHKQVDFTPFSIPLELALDPALPSIQLLQTSGYRNRCSGSSPPPTLLPPPMNPDISISWNEFWALSLSHAVRNIWFRLLHRKIPHKSLLNRFMPDHFPSKNCLICPFAVESLDHFLFSCPKKKKACLTINKTTLRYRSYLNFCNRFVIYQ